MKAKIVLYIDEDMLEYTGSISPDLFSDIVQEAKRRIELSVRTAVMESVAVSIKEDDIRATIDKSREKEFCAFVANRMRRNMLYQSKDAHVDVYISGIDSSGMLLLQIEHGETAEEVIHTTGRVYMYDLNNAEISIVELYKTVKW